MYINTHFEIRTWIDHYQCHNHFVIRFRGRIIMTMLWYFSQNTYTYTFTNFHTHTHTHFFFSIIFLFVSIQMIHDTAISSGIAIQNNKIT